MAQTSLVTAVDGVSVSVTHYGAGRTATAVVICPGFFQSKDTATFRRMSEALAADGDIIAMDFRGHGRSTGLYTFSALEAADLQAVLKSAEERYETLGVLAFSLGAAIAINTLSQRRGRVQSLLAVSAPAAFEDIEFKWWTPEAMRTGLAGTERGSGCRPGNLWLPKLRPLDCVSFLAPMPVTFLHGTRDVIVGAEHSRRLYAAAQEPRQLDIIEDGGHAEALFRDDPAGFLHRVQDWRARTLAVRPQETGM